MNSQAHPGRRWWWACLLLMQVAMAAAALECATCGRTISGRYLTHNGRAYCSNRCLEASLPKCTVCQKPLTGQYLTSSQRSFCSEKCLSTTWPACEICGRRVREYVTMAGHIYCHEHARAPRCSECMLPFAEGLKLADGRHLCDGCRASAIMSMAEAKPLYDQARREMYGLTGFRVAEAPVLVLVDRRELNRQYGGGLSDDDMSVRGFYNREERTVVVKNLLGREVKRETEVTREQIYILYGQTRANFMATAVHELTHDLIADRFPRLREAPDWVGEGICQYLAAIYCRKADFAEALQANESSPHPVYGGGYRYFKQLVGDGNWAALKTWMQQVDVDRLPAALR